MSASLRKRTNGQTFRYVRLVPKADSCNAAKTWLFDRVIRGNRGTLTAVLAANEATELVFPG
jgi:hypothetical protein